MAEKLLVIGGVAGGTSAASRARRINPAMEITIFEKGAFVSYGACDEPYFLAGEIDSWERLLVRKPQQFKEKQNIDVRLNCEVTRIDPQGKSIEVFDRMRGVAEIHACDKLIIATGARPRACTLPGADAKNLFSLKFIEQARALDEYIKANKPTRAVTVGAGFIAMEMAEAFTRRGIKNTILHRSLKPGGNTEPEIAEWLLEELQKQGVVYVPSCKPLSFELNSEGLIKAVHTDQGVFETDLVLWATGVVPMVELAADAGIKLGPTGAIATDERMETSIPGIFAAGDCCEVTHLISRRKVFTPLGDIANKQGWTAGENAAGGDAVYKGAVGSMHFRCFDMEIGMTGLTEAQAHEYGYDVLSGSIDHASRAHAQPKRKPIRVKLVADRNTRRLLGAQIAGREGAALRINTLAVALQAGMTIEEISSLDLAYAPPFSPVMDPVLLAARVLSKDI